MKYSLQLTGKEPVAIQVLPVEVYVVVLGHPCIEEIETRGDEKILITHQPCFYTDVRKLAVEHLSCKGLCYHAPSTSVALR